MYELEINAEFCAAHALVIRGKREAVHGHNWKVTVTLAGEKLDADGLLVDFHSVESALREVVGRFDNQNLNDVKPFDTVNPTAEHVARHIGVDLQGMMPEEVRVARVRVTEAPGCAAVWVAEEASSE